jgi:hypothetical protein
MVALVSKGEKAADAIRAIGVDSYVLRVST